MKEEEQRREKNSPELVRRRWNDGELAEEDPISPQQCPGEEQDQRRRG
jgi:hypothetical protein